MIDVVAPVAVAPLLMSPRYHSIRRSRWNDSIFFRHFSSGLLVEVGLVVSCGYVRHVLYY